MIRLATNPPVHDSAVANFIFPARANPTTTSSIVSTPSPYTATPKHSLNLSTPACKTFSSTPRNLTSTSPGLAQYPISSNPIPLSTSSHFSWTADSPIPTTRTTLVLTPGLAHPLNFGSTLASNIAPSSRGGPGSITNIFPPSSHISPGAVPLSFGKTSIPLGTIA